MNLLIIISVIIECLIYFGLWRFRSLFLLISTLAGAFASVTLLVNSFNLLSLTLSLVMAYRCFNASRIIFGRTQPGSLLKMSRKASLYLSLIQIILVGLIYTFDKFTTDTAPQWILLSIITFLCSLLIIYQLNKNLSKMTPSTNEMTDLSSIPSVTVAIPARNETIELEAMLDNLVKSKYPKLEILVLDDCSQNKRTPEIIRSYASQGVRFLAGKIPDPHWLAKNFAYEQLTEAASGEIILFAGVDILLNEHSISKIVNQLKSSKKSMISFLPLRSAEASSKLTLAQPMRYFWELVPPRRLFNRPPVLSSCWAIYRDKLIEYGSFKATTSSIAPEAYLAKQAIKDGDSYRFSLSSEDLGVISNKNALGQRQTAIRTRYPQLHRRIELVFAFSIIEIVTLILPFVFLALVFLISIPIIAMIFFIISSIFLSISALIISLKTNVNRPLIATLSFLPVVAYDIFMLNLSMFKYEFSKVNWKDRNICEPIMQIIPHLPSPDPSDTQTN